MASKVILLTTLHAQCCSVTFCVGLLKMASQDYKGQMSAVLTCSAETRIAVIVCKRFCLCGLEMYKVQ